MLMAGREIGRLIGVSASHAHRLLHDLSAVGTVSLAPGRTSAVVKRRDLVPPLRYRSISTISTGRGPLAGRRDDHPVGLCLDPTALADSHRLRAPMQSAR
jgi:hypothetical protein